MTSSKYGINNHSFNVWRNKKGYACITVREGQKEKAYLLHRLVYKTEIGPIPDGHEVHHVDGDKLNWTPDNLKAMGREAHQELHQLWRSTEEDNKAGMKTVKDKHPKHPENHP